MKAYKNFQKTFHTVIPNCGKEQCVHDSMDSKSDGWILKNRKKSSKPSASAANAERLRKNQEAQKRKNEREKKKKEAVTFFL